MLRLIRRRWRALLLTLIALLTSSALFLYGWIFHGLPDVDTYTAGLALPSTRIYDRHGQLLYEILPPEQGRNRALTLGDIPNYCVNAVIATEDANYWSHPGVDMVGVARAAWINLRGGQIIAGGSTITQQTARLLLMDFEERANRSIGRKLREMVLAVQLQNRTSKAHVIELYLNQVYFGNLAYGIEAAARTYFHKSARELSVGECALLAGIIQNAVLHDPLTNIEGARQRQAVALRLMVENGYLAAAEAEAAASDALQFGSTRFPIDAPHFVMAVWKQLERDYPAHLYGGGLDVTTTLDLSWQRSAEEVVTMVLDNLNNPPAGIGTPANANNAAVVALDPFTGQILTMLGSPDYFDEDIDGAVNAALALRQPGSTLKPFTYALAMTPDRADPYTPTTVLMDVETPFVTRRLESYTPSNFGFVENGPVSVREALGSSYNIPAVLAMEEIGVSSFVDFAGAIGLESLVDNNDVDLAIALGGGEVRLLDLATAYSIFPNGGHPLDASYLLKVETRQGETLYEWQAPALDEQVLDERVAFLINDILSDNTARLPAFGPNSTLQIGRTAAAKTGTTTDFRDNWVLGYTPNLVVGVWVGNANNTAMVEVTGVSGAGPIYNNFIRRVLHNQPELEFTRPDGLIQVEVCALSGLLPTDTCPLRTTDWFIAGTQPTEYDNVYQTFVIDTRTGDLADETTPPQYTRPETFVVLPPIARDWAVRNGLRLPPLGAAVELGTDAGDLQLLEPDPYTVFELSPIVPREHQRIRLTAGASPQTERVTYYLNDEPIGTASTAPYTLWWTLDIGQHELIAEATLSDGTTTRSAALPFTVIAYMPPQERTILPGD
jgi:penicillin-binding protein 1C